MYSIASGAQVDKDGGQDEVESGHRRSRGVPVPVPESESESVPAAPPSAAPRLLDALR
jgi:hypothetical protein